MTVHILRVVFSICFSCSSRGYLLNFLIFFFRGTGPGGPVRPGRAAGSSINIHSSGLNSILSNRPLGVGLLRFWTSKVPIGKSTVSRLRSASTIASKTTFTTSSASERLNTSGSHCDLSLPSRSGAIASTRSIRVKRASMDGQDGTSPGSLS